jgi:hypothetical protein
MFRSWPTARRDLLLLGLYLTFRGYHSFDGDQAYRLPLLLHRLDPALYADDPFVRSFDLFNPHRGWLSLIAGLSGAVGLPGALLALFAATFLATCRGIDRLACAVWPDRTPLAGTIATVLLLLAKAGNIGTNHLFEATVLDRLAALALGWNALAELVADPSRGSLGPAIMLGLAALIHPSLGLQLVLLAAAFWGFHALRGVRSGIPRIAALRGMASVMVAVLPGLWLNLQSGHLLMDGLPAEEVWTLAVELQSPQHMLPHLWRMPQWLAWSCYLVLAGLALTEGRTEPAARRRLVVLLGLVLVWLTGGWVAVELLRSTRFAVFQPFRMATVSRGLSLVLIAGRLSSLSQRRTWLARTRALLIAMGLIGDWMMVVAASVELSTTLAEGLQARWRSAPGFIKPACFLVALGWGLWFLARHDTESGHWPMLLALAGALAAWMVQDRIVGLPSARPALVLCLAWMVPFLALLAIILPRDSALARTPIVRGLITRCRIAPVPIDDVERLAVWCRDYTPVSARFVGPPGPKTFRLWSRRSLAFNRAGSPYHAAGLAAWFDRFRDHVGSAQSSAAFVRRYQSHRHEVESGYDRLREEELAALARRQGADHVIAAAPRTGHVSADQFGSDRGPLRLLHVEGRLAVYRVEGP